MHPWSYPLLLARVLLARVLLARGAADWKTSLCLWIGGGMLLAKAGMAVKINADLNVIPWQHVRVDPPL
jgi:hypothetical protein